MSLNWQSVDAASKRVAAWPEWKRNYKITEYSMGHFDFKEEAAALRTAVQPKLTQLRNAVYGEGITMSVAIMYRPIDPKASSYLSSRSNLRATLEKAFGGFPIELDKTEIGILTGIAFCDNEEIYELIEAIRAKGTIVLEIEA